MMTASSFIARKASFFVMHRCEDSLELSSGDIIRARAICWYLAVERLYLFLNKVELVRQTF